MSLRKARAKRAVQSQGGATGFLSTTLFRLALQQLAAALQERWNTKDRSGTTHRSESAIGCVVFCACGIEALVNSVIWWNRGSSTVSGTRSKAEIQLAEASIRDKIGLLVPQEDVPQELLDLICLRDEIVHFIPAMAGRENVPPWLSGLSKRGLLLGEPDVDEKDGYVLFVDRLCSYRLAYWAFETSESALLKLHEYQGFARPKIAHDLNVLRRFRTLAAPGNLPE